jgi:hypothetical protein
MYSSKDTMMLNNEPEPGIEREGSAVHGGEEVI